MVGRRETTHLSQDNTVVCQLVEKSGPRRPTTQQLHCLPGGRVYRDVAAMSQASANAAIDVKVQFGVTADDGAGVAPQPGVA